MKIEPITFGSLFSGAGGLDLGLCDAGMLCVFQVENDPHCLTVLNRHWPAVPKNEVRPCVGLVGGDPCPVRTVASRIHGTRQPDLSGYFLAMVQRCRPRWVVRENVCSPDVVEFAGGLDLLGYANVVLTTDAAQVTGQMRRREWVVGFDQQGALDRFIGACIDAQGRDRARPPLVHPTEPWLGKFLTCLTTRRNRVDARDVFVYEGPERGLRVLSHEERERLQGWPAGWTGGVSDSARERMVGNGAVAPIAEWIGLRITEVYADT